MKTEPKQADKKNTRKPAAKEAKIREQLYPKNAVLIMQDFYGMLYGFIAKRVIDSFGEEGEQVVRRALRDYGVTRGKELKEKHAQLGLENHIVNLMTYYDLPSSDELETKREIFEPEQEVTETRDCGLYDVWKKHGMLREGKIYCEEIHHAMWAAYNEKLVVTQKEILTRGNDRCTWEIHLGGGIHPKTDTAQK